MSVKLFKTIFLLFIVFSFNSCKDVTYHKNNLEKDLENLLQKENHIQAEVFAEQETVYIDMDLGIASFEDDEILEDVFNKLNDALSAAVRVVISGDSDIKFAVVSAYPEDKSFLFRIIQNVDDFKSYYYMRISMSDFLSRNIVEIKGPSAAPGIIADKHNIDINEFAGRLIVSSIMANARKNPLFSALISNADLRFISVKNGFLVLQSNIDMISEARSALLVSLKKEADIYLKKYEGIHIERIAVYKNNNIKLIDFRIKNK